MVDPFYRRFTALPAASQPERLKPVQALSWQNSAVPGERRPRGANRRRAARRATEHPVLLDSRSVGDRRQLARRCSDYCTDGISRILGND